MNFNEFFIGSEFEGESRECVRGLLVVLQENLHNLFDSCDMGSIFFGCKPTIG